MATMRNETISNIHPKNQNAIQKIGFIAASLLAILIIFLHNPLDGYESIADNSLTALENTLKCDDALYEKLNQDQLREKFSDEELATRNHRNVIECEAPPLPLSEWRSTSPMISWLGSVVHTVATILLVLIMGIIWIWVFKTSENRH